MNQIFSCKQCGDCCKGYGGTFVTPKDIQAISEFLGIDEDMFVDKYCQFSGSKPLLAQNGNGFCAFWDKLCTIHPVKPRMCRMWPFIPGVLKDPLNWEIMSNSCPGMQKGVATDLLIQIVKKELDRQLNG